MMRLNSGVDNTPFNSAVLNAQLDRALLYRMLRIRRVEEAIAAAYGQQKMRCPVHLSIGQEAVAAATGAALNQDDFAVSTHRAHAHYLAKGGSLPAMIAELYGKAGGCSGGRGGSMHLIDLAAGFKASSAIVGNTIPVGVGLGLSIQLHGTDQVSVVFLGDGATEEGVFYESANFAAVKQLPVLFVCENNLYSVYSPLEVRQPKGRSIAGLAEGIGLKGLKGDGNDVKASHALVSSAVESIRSGNGPVLLEFDTYRWREHCGPNYDNDIGYRTEAEFQRFKALDPIASLQESMSNIGSFDEAYLKKLTVEIDEEIQGAFEFAENSPFPDPSSVNDFVYKS